MVIKENIEPWSCRLNQANWSLEEDERRRCLLGTIDDMYKQRANSSGCFPILYSNKKHLSSSISFEFITMSRLVSHVSFLINWCEWTSHAQEPSGLESTMKNGIVGDDERRSIVKEIKSLLLSWCVALRQCFVILICLRNKDVENFDWLNVYVCARKWLWLEREKNCRCRQQWNCDDDNDDDEAQAKSRMGLTLSLRIYICIVLFFLSLSLSSSFLVSSSSSSSSSFFFLPAIQRKIDKEDITWLISSIFFFCFVHHIGLKSFFKIIQLNSFDESSYCRWFVRSFVSSFKCSVLVGWMMKSVHTFSSVR